MMSKVKLGPLVEIKTGKLDANAAAADGQYPFFTCSKDNKKINTYSFDGEYVIVAGNGDLNVKYYSGKFDAYQRTYTLKPSPQLDGKFLYHFMSKYVERLREQSIGGVIKYIKLGNLTNALIPLPSIEEQNKIAAILDAADDYRQKTKALIDKYDQLTQSLFLDMFGDPVTNPKGWDVKKGNELFKFTSGKYNPTKNLSPQYDFPSYGGNGITGMSQSFLIDFPTIVIGRVGAYCGSIHLTKGKIWITDNAIYIKEFYKDVNLTYAYFFFRGYNLNRFADFSGQPKITQKPMQNMSFMYPDLSLQNQFAERVAQIEKQKQQAEASLVKAEELFSSLLQRAFKGELTS